MMNSLSEFSESSSSSGSRLVTVRKSSSTASSLQHSGTDPIPNWSEPDWSEFGAQNDPFDAEMNQHRLNFKRKLSHELPRETAFKIPKPPRPKWNLLNPGPMFQESSYYNEPPKSPVNYGNQQDWAKGPCIGRGGQAKVYLMTHKVVGENCVMKVIDISRDEAEVRKLKQECEILMKLHHARIVKFLWFSIDTNEREVRIYMELLQGSLKDRIQRNGPLYEDEAILLCYQILEGLAFIHGLGIIHRDIKSANILLDENRCAKISDFGISRQCTNVDQTQTRTPSLGTYHYMSPDAIHGKYSSKSDIWSVGCTLVDMLCGAPPNSDLTDIQALFKVGNTKVASYRLPPGTTEHMIRFVAWLLAPESKDRPGADQAMEHPVFHMLKPNGPCLPESSSSTVSDGISSVSAESTAQNSMDYQQKANSPAPQPEQKCQYPMEQTYSYAAKPQYLDSSPVGVPTKPPYPNRNISEQRLSPYPIAVDERCSGQQRKSNESPRPAISTDDREFLKSLKERTQQRKAVLNDLAKQLQEEAMYYGGRESTANSDQARSVNYYQYRNSHESDDDDDESGFYDDRHMNPGFGGNDNQDDFEEHVQHTHSVKRTYY